MDKQRRFLYLFAACFLAGITLGSVVGLGGGVGVTLSESVSPGRYLTAASITGLPFWCLILMPQTFAHRLMGGGVAMMIKGILVGCSSVYIFSAADRSVYFYAINILPQLLSTVPLYFFAIIRTLKSTDEAYTNTSIITNSCVAILVDLLSSCVQYLFFYAFYTIQVIFITNF